MAEVPETKYDRDLQRFDCSGLDLNRPVDSVKKGKFPYLKNVRSYQGGRVEPRFGITDIAEVVAGQSPVHSCRRLNDPNASTWARIVGTGSHLAYGQAAFTDADSGYSGDPLALQPWRPQASPTPYMYVADRSRMRKITAAGVLDTIGYAAPNAAPGVALSNTPKYKVVDSLSVTTGWVQALTAGAPSLISRTPGGASGTTTTIAQIIYDSGTTGWACVNLTSMAGVGYGERLSFNGGTPELATVQDVFPSSKATTIASIVYDAGTSGICSIVFADAIQEVAIDAMVRNTTIGENARIVAVVDGPNGLKSIRVVTTGTWAATNAISVLATLRAYLVNAHAAAETVNKDAMRSAVTAGTGTLSKIATLDLSVIDTGVPSSPDDYMCIGLRVDRPDLVSELKIQLDVDRDSVVGGPAFSGTEFTRNFYTRSFRASDLTPSLRNLQPIVTTQQTIAQRQVIDDAQASYAEPPVSSTIVYTDPYTGETITGDVTTQADSPIVGSQQLESGDVQWVGLRFHLAELIRVGTDDTRTLKDVNSIRIVAIVTGSVTLDMDSWWIGGGYGPDAGDTTAIPYSYRYRVRNPATNVPSNPSPATRLLVSPYRQSVAIVPTQYAAPTGTSITATNLVLDIERFGGQIAEWHYVGTVANAASPGFIDTFPDDIVGGNPIFGIQNYQPWPILGVPVTGTTGIVSGTSVKDAGTTFNTSWAMGTRILISNQPYTIYRVISTSLLEIVENAGSQTGVTWRIDEPTILAQPLPCLWIHDDTFFACGDTINPGRLYWGNPGSETTDTINYRDITSPSEPLMNGVSYNIRSYVFSSENLFQILRSTSLEAISENVASANIVQWVSEKIPNGKGLFARWALTRNPAPIICFLSKDGIYATDGGSPHSLTDEDLYPLFPNEGNLGTNVNGVYAPYIADAYLSTFRLEYYDDFLYFDYWHIPSTIAILSACPTDPPIIGAPYSFTFTASGGVPPYTWTATGLPAGLTIGATTGTVSGTPTETGTFPYTVTATDSLDAPATIDCEFVIAVFVITACPTDEPVIDEAYTPFTFTATGGTPPYTWSATGLPTGMSIDPTTGILSGTPTVSGTFPYTVTATDANGVTATIDCEFVIASSDLVQLLEYCPECIDYDGTYVFFAGNGFVSRYNKAAGTWTNTAITGAFDIWDIVPVGLYAYFQYARIGGSAVGRILISDWSTVTTINSPIQAGGAHESKGLCTDGTSLFASDYNTSTTRAAVSKYDIATFAYVSSVDLDSDAGAGIDATSIRTDGTNIFLTTTWHSSVVGHYTSIYKVNIGSFTQTAKFHVTFEGFRVYGIALDSTYCYYVDDLAYPASNTYRLDKATLSSQTILLTGTQTTQFSGAVVPVGSTLYIGSAETDSAVLQTALPAFAAVTMAHDLLPHETNTRVFTYDGARFRMITTRGGNCYIYSWSL